MNDAIAASEFAATRLDITVEQYHALPFLSSSFLKRVLRKPETVGQELKITPSLQRSFDFGCRVESLACHIPWDGSIKKAEDSILAVECAENLHSHPVAGPLIRSSDYQVPIVYPSRVYQRNGEESLPCKALLDGLKTDDRIVWDMKTSRAPDPEGFRQEIAKLDYDLQAVKYLTAAELIGDGGEYTFLWIVVGNFASDYPGKVWVYELSDEFYQLGNQKLRIAFDRQWKCFQTGRWEKQDSSEILTLQPPRWANYAIEEL